MSALASRSKRKEVNTKVNVASGKIVLEGCGPEPLMAYFKALSVFRLVAEQAEPNVRAFWWNDVFVLDTALDRGRWCAFSWMSTGRHR